jgi:hypothetical protein
MIKYMKKHELNRKMFVYAESRGSPVPGRPYSSPPGVTPKMVASFFRRSTGIAATLA